LESPGSTVRDLDPALRRTACVSIFIVVTCPRAFGTEQADAAAVGPRVQAVDGVDGPKRFTTPERAEPTNNELSGWQNPRP
jgi:hypothetical protein